MSSLWDLIKKNKKSEPVMMKLSAVNMTLGVPTSVRLERLAKLDLTNVSRKLMEPYPEGKGWSEEQAIEAERWYKRYLATIILYPDATQHVPNGPIDFFWHQHILDTMKYGPDCEHVLGYFLHHYPYFGLNGDAAERDSAFDETNAIYRQMFGEDCIEMRTFQVEKTGGCKGEGCHDVGAGCGQGPACSTPRNRIKDFGRPLNLVASGCGHSGSGTGCGQGGRGG